MDPEHACSPPHHILGLTIRSRTRIYVSYILPNVLELLVYIVQIVADCAVSYQHFKSHQTDFGWGTLSLILLPPVVTCVLVLSSKAQWIKPKQNGTQVKFVCMQLLQMVLFPFFVIYRSAKLVFWSIEALFHDDDDEARMECLEKAEECSTCELYRLVQAYGQSAPQIILQLYHMLTQDLFRNFQTTNVQAISLVFSAIDLASITATYQRFESQRQVGRHYPWSTDEQKQESRLKLQKNKCLQEECIRKKRDSERTLNKFPASEKIMENFKARNQDNVADNARIYVNSQNMAESQESLVQVSEPISHSVQVHGYDELDNDAGDEQTALLATHLTDDDKIKTKPLLKVNSQETLNNIEEFDQVPNTPPPLPPKSTRFDDTTDGPQLRSQTSTQSSNEANKRRSRAFSHLETLKDMLLINAQLYIKENVPRPPKMLIKRVEDSNNPGKTPPQSPQDVVDFFLPRPTKVVNGIQQDDFAAKSIAFFGWIAFVIMRMLSLSAFCVFFPKAFLIIMGVHYLIMLAALYLESRFQGKLNRTIFYFLLAYVYLYILLEFRVKFKHIRVWFVCYFLLSMAENLTMTSLSSCSQVIPQQTTTNQVNTTTPQLTCVPSSPSPQHLNSHSHHHHHQQTLPAAINLNVDVVAMRHHVNNINAANNLSISLKKLLPPTDKEKPKTQNPEKRKAEDSDQLKDLKKAKLETKALKAKRPGFTDERYHETSYYIENGLRKVYPYYFTFTTFTKGRWVGEKILDVFAREFRAHPAEEYERCIKSGTLTVNYEKVPVDYRLKHNDLLANIVHRHEVPVTSQPITIVHMDDDIVVVNKPASIPVHPCGRYRHNTVVFILAKEYNLKNLRTIHRLDRLTSGLLLFGRSPKKARQMEHQIRNRQVQKEYICRVEGDFPDGIIECNEPIEVVSYKIGVCKVSPKGKDCTTTFQKISYNGQTSVVLCKPLTGRMHQIRVHLQYLGFPVVNDPLYNHEVFGPLKGRGGDIGGKTDEELVRDLINIHNAENWLGIDGDSDISMFKTIKGDCDVDTISLGSETKGHVLSDDDSEITSRETSPTCPNSPRLTEPASQHLKNCIEMAQVKNTDATDINNHKTADTNNSNEVYEKNDSYSHIKVEVTVATQTGHESPDMAFNAEKMTSDKHCYECKVRYRDPKPKDLVMYLHAWKYKGPGWEYETMLPNWGSADWTETD